MPKESPRANMLTMSEIYTFIDYAGTIIFAITGASIAGRSKFDFFGMLFLAFLTAVGGGTVRDIIISEPIFWTQNPIYLYLIFAATLSTFFLNHLYERHKSILLFFDTLGLGLFVVIGTHKSLVLNFNLETAFIMGTTTAVLGGILRSAYSGEYSILYNRELYATVAATSSFIFILSYKLGIGINICALLAILSAFALRYTSIKLNIRLPSLRE